MGDRLMMKGGHGPTIQLQDLITPCACMKGKAIGFVFSGLLRQPQLVIVQRLVRSLYLALITNYYQLHDREYH